MASDAVGKEATQVGFALSTNQPQPTMPANKMGAEFCSVSDVQVTPIPKSQLATVITSYEKTIGQFSGDRFGHKLGQIGPK